MPPIGWQTARHTRDVVSVGANGKGTAPVVSELKTFALDGSRATLIVDAQGAKPSIGTVVAGAAVGGLALSVPTAAAYRASRISVTRSKSNTATAAPNVSNNNSSSSVSSPTVTTDVIGNDYSLGGNGAGLSDRRLKREIQPVGALASSLTLYRFRYAWSDEIFVGVLAQEVLDFEPEAVLVDDSGYLRVDYAKLGFSMLRWRQWHLLERLGFFQCLKPSASVALA